MGHANNARFLTYCESARIDYWETVTGEPFGLATHGESESMILADIRVSYRAQAYFGERLTVESRIGRIGRTSFTLEHRVTAPESERGHARLVATAEAVQVLYDYAEGAPAGRSPTRRSRASRRSRAGRSGAEPAPTPRSGGRSRPRSGRRTRSR